jgi:hypothetical protein
MNRTVRLGLVLIAAAMHLAAPVTAYAMRSSQALPNDLCSAARSAGLTPDRSDVPQPVSSDHHCAHAPCCASGTLDAAAPPSSALSVLPTLLAGEALPAVLPTAAPFAPVVAAQPRGPPSLS